MTARTFLWALWLLSVGLFGLMLWISFLHLMPDGTPILDAWIWPYDGAKVDAYLSALGMQGITKYLGPLQILDTGLPAVLGLALALTLLRLTHNGRVLPRALIMLFPLGFVAADFWENAQIARMLRHWPQPIPFEWAEFTHQLTMAKFVLLGLCAVLLLGLVLWNDAKGTR